MNFIIQFFYVILFEPFLNVLVLLYVYLPGRDFGIAVIILTIIIKLILHPLTIKGLRQQKITSELQPKLKEIKEKYKNDKAQQSRAMMELYKKEKINPMSGCLPLLLQFPIIIALYKVFLDGFKVEVLEKSLYGFVPDPGVISNTFLGVINMESRAFVIVLALMAGVGQFIQMKMTTASAKKAKEEKGKDIASAMQGQMLYVFPVISVLLVYKLGAVIGLYWLVTILFSIVEQHLVNKKYDRQKGQEEN